MGQEESGASLSLDKTHLSWSRVKLTVIPFFIPPDHPVTHIDVSYNRLNCLPKKLLHLESLDLSANELYKLEEKLQTTEIEYPSLKKLKLSANRLSEIPPAVLLSKSLVDLALDRNRLREISTDLPKVKNIDLFLNRFEQFPTLPESTISVNLGFNRIKNLDVFLPNIRKLKLSGNNLTEISPTCSLPELVDIDLSFNRLVSLPDIKTFAPKIETIILSYNFLSDFPTGMPQTVKKIEISHNCMSKWIDSLVDLKSLVFLDISYNEFESIPELPPTIETFVADHNKFSDAVPIAPLGLRGLQLNHNDFAGIPVFSQCRVTHLLMCHNNIEIIESDHICPEIKQIDFTCNRIREIPDSLFRFSNLTMVMLTKNNISMIPESIVDSKIEVLYISDNPISELPKLPDTLVEISACNCKFTELPESLFTLPVLQVINMSSNQIETISEFPVVEVINLSQNLLTKIPPVPEFVSSIDLSHNKLAEFVADADLPFLQTLDLSHNCLTSLKLKGCPSLDVLKLSHNPSLSYKLDLSAFPLTTVDLFGSEVRHTSCVPSIRELVTTDWRLIKSANNVQLKYYRGVRCGYSETIGARPSMEDSLIIRESNKPKTPSLYGVIDGHGGYQTSAICASMIPELFQKLEKKSIAGMQIVLKQVNENLSKMQVTDGATIVLALVTPRLISVAHLGDARALVVRRDGTVTPLTYDHKPTERGELDVLKAAGAYVASRRLSSYLAISRAMGDFMVDGVSRTPDAATHRITQDDIRLVLACDGVFDVMDNDEVGSIVAECLDVHRAAASVKNEAIIRGSLDNVSVIVIDIELPPATEK